MTLYDPRTDRAIPWSDAGMESESRRPPERPGERGRPSSATAPPPKGRPDTGRNTTNVSRRSRYAQFTSAERSGRSRPATAAWQGERGTMNFVQATRAVRRRWWIRSAGRALAPPRRRGPGSRQGDPRGSSAAPSWRCSLPPTEAPTWFASGPCTERPAARTIGSSTLWARR